MPYSLLRDLNMTTLRLTYTTIIELLLQIITIDDFYMTNI